MRNRWIGLVAATFVSVVGLAHVASADTILGTIQAKLGTPSPADTIHLTYNGSSYHVYAGALNWTQTGGTYTANPKSANFATFCIDIKDQIGIGGTYTYDVHTDLTKTQTPISQSNATAVEFLYDAHYAGATTPDGAAEFQVAIWDILFPGQFTVTSVDSPGSFSIVAGASSWATAALVKTGTPNTGLYALVSDPVGAQDQALLPFTATTTQSPTPLPTSLAGGLVLLAGAAGMKVHGRRGGVRATAC